MNGLDISHFQQKIDWVKVVNSSFQPKFVFIKATQGVDFVDPMFFIHAKNAKDAGMKIGFYHFCSLNSHDISNDAKAEAQWFVKNIKLAPQVDYPLVLDIEANPGKLSKDEVLNWINTFFYELAQLGQTDYILYSYASFLNENLPTNHKLGNIKLWLAAYAPTYKVPLGWKAPIIWQYSEKGTIDGVPGLVDLNKTI